MTVIQSIDCWTSLLHRNQSECYLKSDGRENRRRQACTASVRGIVRPVQRLSIHVVFFSVYHTSVPALYSAPKLIHGSHANAFGSPNHQQAGSLAGRPSTNKVYFSLLPIRPPDCSLANVWEFTL